MPENFGRRSRMLRHPPARLDGIKFRSGTTQLLECDCFELNRRGCWLTSPRLRGEVGLLRAMQSIVRSNPGEGDYPRVRSCPRAPHPDPLRASFARLDPARAGRGRSGPPVQPKLIMLQT